MNPSFRAGGPNPIPNLTLPNSNSASASRPATGWASSSASAPPPPPKHPSGSRLFQSCAEEENQAELLGFLDDRPLDAFMRLLLNQLESQRLETTTITNRARLLLFYSQLADESDRLWFQS